MDQGTKRRHYGWVEESPHAVALVVAAALAAAGVIAYARLDMGGVVGGHRE